MALAFHLREVAHEGELLLDGQAEPPLDSARFCIMREPDIALATTAKPGVAVIVENPSGVFLGAVIPPSILKTARACCLAGASQYWDLIW